MRAAIYHGRRDLRLEEIPEPSPGPGELKLRVRFNGICGSDLHEYYDGPITTPSEPRSLTGVKNPVVLGHELSGEVIAEMAAGAYPHEKWVENIALERLIEDGFERLHRQEGTKIPVSLS